MTLFLYILLYIYNGDDMSKRFRSKKKIRHDILIKYLVLFIIGIVIIRICFLLVIKLSLFNYIFESDKIGKFRKYVVDSTINRPLSLLNYSNKDNDINADILIPTNYTVNNKSLIYIYNTHQKEEYLNNKTVLDASLVFKDELKKYNVETIVEKRDITEFMRTNNISYSYSYYASKFYIEDVMSKNKLDLIIDLHRDSVDKKLVTYKIDGKSYAKILFVVGGENKNYKDNYSLSHHLNNMIVSKYPDISRGIIIKSGKNVNGVYNQNLSKDMILLELGSNTSSFEEVKNTITLLAPIIGEYLHEKG